MELITEVVPVEKQRVTDIIDRVREIQDGALDCIKYTNFATSEHAIARGYINCLISLGLLSNDQRLELARKQAYLSESLEIEKAQQVAATTVEQINN